MNQEIVVSVVAGLFVFEGMKFSLQIALAIIIKGSSTKKEPEKKMTFQERLEFMAKERGR